METIELSMFDEENETQVESTPAVPTHVKVGSFKTTALSHGVDGVRICIPKYCIMEYHELGLHPARRDKHVDEDGKVTFQRYLFMYVLEAGTELVDFNNNVRTLEQDTAYISFYRPNPATPGLKNLYAHSRPPRADHGLDPAEQWSKKVTISLQKERGAEITKKIVIPKMIRRCLPWLKGGLTIRCSRQRHDDKPREIIWEVQQWQPTTRTPSE